MTLYIMYFKLEKKTKSTEQKAESPIKKFLDIAAQRRRSGGGGGGGSPP